MHPQALTAGLLFLLEACSCRERGREGAGVKWGLSTPMLLRVQADTEQKLSSWLVETFANSPLGLTAEQGAISLEYASASPDVNGAAPALSDAYLSSPPCTLCTGLNALDHTPSCSCMLSLACRCMQCCKPWLKLPCAARPLHACTAQEHFGMGTLVALYARCCLQD